MPIAECRLLSCDEMHSLIVDCQLLIAPIESRVRLSPPSEFNQHAASPSSVSRDAAVIVLVLSSFAVAQQPSNPQQPSPASQNPASPEQVTPGTESKASPATENATPNK